uniref:Uncharacterized protein n=1 Tax=Romanomermis culicivorax TaxID=13658 RepID=A0A915JEY9_ROMCU
MVDNEKANNFKRIRVQFPDLQVVGDLDKIQSLMATETVLNLNQYANFLELETLEPRKNNLVNTYSENSLKGFGTFWILYVEECFRMIQKWLQMLNFSRGDVGQRQVIQCEAPRENNPT